MVRPVFLCAALLVAGLLAPTTPASAGWTLVAAARPVRIGRLEVTPRTAWNAADGGDDQSQSWTRDGFVLNRLDIMSDLAPGRTLVRRAQRAQRAVGEDQPYFGSALGLVDLADLFERSFRQVYRPGTFTRDRIEPARLAGHPGVELQFRFSLPGDSLARRGVVRIAMIEGRLFLITFTAADLHFFEAGLGEAGAIMDSARLALSAPAR